MAENDSALVLILVGLAALSVAAVIYLLLAPYLSGQRRTEKRLESVMEGRTPRVARTVQADLASNRRKQVAESLKEIDERQKAKNKVSLRLRLQRAGITAAPRSFMIASAASGVLCGVASYVFFPGGTLALVGASAFVGALGVPRWVLAFLTKRRQNKFVNEFANAIDVIVRGVKSGLPLHECLGIIARESPPPVCQEFSELVEQQRLGVPLSEAFERMMQRIPLAEVKFFAIVIGIQQQAGGNLSEALANLSGVLRDRKRMQSKVSALAAEAKASAVVLGALPFVVTGLVYLSTPEYIQLLWQTRFGQFMLFASFIWMTMGILVMKKMINFKY